MGPVAGAAQVVVASADPNALVFNDRATPEPDQAAIDAFAGEVQEWLDRHLTALQQGEEGMLEEVAAEGLLDGADPELRDALTTDLASPGSPVDQAWYHLVVAHSGRPLWLRAHVTIVDRAGVPHEVGFVFTPQEGSPPALIAAGPGPLGA